MTNRYNAEGWRRSSYSGTGNNCVEAAALPDGRIAVRDSKDPHGPKLVFTSTEWAAFTGRTKGGAFDRA
jgi:Domain of unknown function (DUF397)